MRQEIEILRELDHPGIIRLLEVYETPEHIHLVLDRLEGGELFERIRTQNTYSEKTAIAMMRNLFAAMAVSVTKSETSSSHIANTRSAHPFVRTIWLAVICLSKCSRSVAPSGRGRSGFGIVACDRSAAGKSSSRICRAAARSATPSAAHREGRWSVPSVPSALLAASSAAATRHSAPTNRPPSTAASTQGTSAPASQAESVGEDASESEEDLPEFDAEAAEAMVPASSAKGCEATERACESF